jgi:hypothetical protein
MYQSRTHGLEAVLVVNLEENSLMASESQMLIAFYRDVYQVSLRANRDDNEQIA